MTRKNLFLVMMVVALSLLTLIIDSGSIMNADITLVPKSTLIIRDDGIISMANGKKYEAPIGVNVIIEEGRIN